MQVEGGQARRGWPWGGALGLVLLLQSACTPTRFVAPPSLDSGLALSEAEQAVAQVGRRAVISIFYEYGEGQSGGRRSGSGFLVEPRLVLTDYHVMGGKPRYLTLLGPDGREGPLGRLDTISEAYDLAVITLAEDWPVPRLPLAARVVPGSRGVALAGRWVRTECSRHTAMIEVRTVALARASRQGWPTELLLLPPTHVCRGFSGGPVLNMQGEVIGVVRALLRVNSAEKGTAGAATGDWVAATSVRHVHEALAALRQRPR